MAVKTKLWFQYTEEEIRQLDSVVLLVGTYKIAVLELTIMRKEELTPAHTNTFGLLEDELNRRLRFYR